MPALYFCLHFAKIAGFCIIKYMLCCVLASHCCSPVPMTISDRCRPSDVSGTEVGHVGGPAGPVAVYGDDIPWRRHSRPAAADGDAHEDRGARRRQQHTGNYNSQTVITSGGARRRQQHAGNYNSQTVITSSGARRRQQHTGADYINTW